MKKYQLSINIGKSADRNSASTKAVKDCIELFSSLGYHDFNLFFSEETSSFARYLSTFKELLRFFAILDKGDLVGVQYPILNNVFKYFIIAARVKKVKFFCVIHDIESLRLGGKDDGLVNREVKNLNYYDCLIVHNTTMLQWLRQKGFSSKMIPLGVFDYLLKDIPNKSATSFFSHSIVFAGNLAKSNFIYSLDQVANWTFKIYGPNFSSAKNKSKNVVWRGEFAPDQVVYELDGNFGLIWDGDTINECDEVLGNYLNYNNPHKFSLYLAAGLPVIAPKRAAIAKVISDFNIGILIEDLRDLDKLQISNEYYQTLKYNCDQIQHEVVRGKFFVEAVEVAERQLTAG